MLLIKEDGIAGEPVRIRAPREVRHEMADWLCDHVGFENWSVGHLTFGSDVLIYIDDSRYHMIFNLKWGEYIREMPNGTAQ